MSHGIRDASTAKQWSKPVTSLIQPLANQPWLRSSSYAEVKSFEMQEGPAHGLHENDRNSSRTRKSTKSRWQWLSRRTLVLCAFVVLLMLSLTALVLLRILDKRDVGFGVAPSTTLQYSWKFGPTAFFVVIIAFWRQYEYRIKTQAAWKQMAQGPSPAKHTVLLDYLSPILPSAFWRSVLNHHWDVTLGICVFAFLKLAVVFSTGLLTMQLATLRSEEVTTQLAPGKERQDIVDMADEVALSYVGWRQRDLTVPESTSRFAAFQEFSNSGNQFPPNSTISADVKAFYPTLECETATTSHYFDPQEMTADVTGDSMVYFYINYTSNTASGEIEFRRSACNHARDSCPTKRLVPYFDVLNSDKQAVSGNFLTTDTILISLLSLESEVKPGNHMLNITDAKEYPMQQVLEGEGWLQSVSWISTILCKASYSIETGTLTATNTDNGLWLNKTISKPLTQTHDVLQNYTSANMTFDVDSIMNNIGTYAEAKDQNPNTYVDSLTKTKSWFQLMFFEVDGSDIAVFEDPSTMIEPAIKIFQGLASTWVATWLDIPDHLTTQSTFTYRGIRLRISSLPFWLMVGFIGAALVSLILLLILHTTAITPVHSGHLAKDALTLRTDTLLSKCLEGLGSSSDYDMKARFSSTTFRTQDHDLKIIPSNVAALSDTQEKSPAAASVQHWSPLPTQIWFISLT